MQVCSVHPVQPKTGSVPQRILSTGTNVIERHVKLTLWPMSRKDDATGSINLAGIARFLSAVLAMNSCKSSRSDWPRPKLSSLLRPREQRHGLCPHIYRPRRPLPRPSYHHVGLIPLALSHQIPTPSTISRLQHHHVSPVSPDLQVHQPAVTPWT